MLASPSYVKDENKKDFLSHILLGAGCAGGGGLPQKSKGGTHGESSGNLWEQGQGKQAQAAFPNASLPSGRISLSHIHSSVAEHTEICLLSRFFHTRVSTVVPWYLQGTGSRTPLDTQIRGCSSPCYEVMWYLRTT